LREKLHNSKLHQPLKHFENDVAYIAGWLKKLKDDRRFILFASSKAQRAVDYILNQPIADVKEEIGPVADVSEK